MPPRKNSSTQDVTSGVVADGRQRAARAAVDRERVQELQREVEESFRDRIAAAGLLRRWLLHLQMRAAVRRAIAAEIEKAAPSSALYGRV